MSPYRSVRIRSQTGYRGCEETPILRARPPLCVVWLTNWVSEETASPVAAMATYRHVRIGSQTGYRRRAEAPFGRVQPPSCEDRLTIRVVEGQVLSVLVALGTVV